MIYPPFSTGPIISILTPMLIDFLCFFMQCLPVMLTEIFLLRFNLKFTKLSSHSKILWQKEYFALKWQMESWKMPVISCHSETFLWFFHSHLVKLYSLKVFTYLCIQQIVTVSFQCAKNCARRWMRRGPCALGANGGERMDKQVCELYH